MLVDKHMAPELPSEIAPSADNRSTKNVAAAMEQLPSETNEKSNYLASILTISTLFLIGAASLFGIWYLLSSDNSTPETTTTKVVKATQPPSNDGPIARTKAAISKVTAAKETEEYAGSAGDSRS
jgi:hypothetical protein